jgi:regulator of replication initiation timing
MPDDEYKYKILEEIKNLSKANNDIMNEISENNKKLFELVQINQELQLKLISSL